MMDTLSIRQRIKFAEPVWHDQAYEHPQLKQHREKDFYGRQEAVEKANAVLRFSSRPIIFIGERRAGKTSILKLFMRSLGNKPEYITIETSWLEIHSASDLMYKILGTIYVKLELTDDALQKVFKTITSPTEFRQALQSILKGVPDRTVVIGIDEFDAIIMEWPDDEEKKKIISMIISLVETEEPPVRIILAMTREPGKIEMGYSSPLTTKSEQIRLEPFSKSELDEMILGILENEIQIAEHELAQIFTLSGGWPYFAKALLYYWIQNSDVKNRLELAKEKAIQDPGLSDTLEHNYVKHWDDPERTILLLMAKQGGQISTKDTSVLEPPVKAAGRELAKRGYLLTTGDGYSFRIGMLQNWLSQWTRFEEQTQKHIAKILVLIERKKDPWAGIEKNDIFDSTTGEEK